MAVVGRVVCMFSQGQMIDDHSFLKWGKRFSVLVLICHFLPDNAPTSFRPRMT